MESSPASNGGDRKRHGSSGKRKRSINHTSEDEDEERKMEGKQDAPKQGKEKRESEEEDKPSAKHWNCLACTFLNEASRFFCEMCETPNPSPPPAAGRVLGGAASASEWSCAACTMVNPMAMRICAVCGTLNPRPVVPTDLSIVKFSQALGDESLSSCSEDSDEDDSSSDEDSEETWLCKSCDTLSSGRTCLNCFAQLPKAGRQNGNTEEKTKKEEKKQARLKKRKRRKREKKLQEKAKMAYGVSIYELKNLILEPTSSRLVDTLQMLTHTLAMTDASADNEWADGPSFLVRGFGGGSSSTIAKDPELLTVLANLFSGHERPYPAEVRLLAVQSINYLMKMDRHMFARSKMVDIVRLYLSDLLAWKDQNSVRAASSSTAKSGQMIVEECLTGLSSMCSTEGFALREVVAQENFAGYLSFLLSLVDGEEGKSDGFHPSIVMTALGILQKCCLKLRWSAKSSKKHLTGNAIAKTSAPLPYDSQLTLELATKLVVFLRHVLQHKHVPLHVKAAKCLLLIFHRTPCNSPEITKKLVTSEVLRKFVAVVVNTNSDESDESRLAMVTLLLHLFDNRPQLVNMFVREKMYTNLFSGVLPLLQSSSTALRTNVLKLTSMLTRVVCKKHSLESATSSRRNSVDGLTLEEASTSTPMGLTPRSPWNRRNRQRLNSLPDPDVLSTLLLDFIRADSIPAVTVLLKDGADLNFPKIYDVQGNELDKPLNVAVEWASLGMVRLLLKRGADIHQVGIGGTALHVAARTGRCHVAAFLLQCGARVQAKDREKKTVLDVVNSTYETRSGDESLEAVPSPMKKLLELYQRSAGMRDYNSDLSESDEMTGDRSQAWFYASDQDDEYGDDDDDDDMDDDELEGEEGYYMDYDEDEDDDNIEGFDGVGQHDEETGDRSDDDVINVTTRPNQRCLDQVASGSEVRTERSFHDGDGDSLDTTAGSGALSGSDKDCSNNDAVLEHEAFSATADEVYEFSLAITQCLLSVLRDMDVQNVERSVISTVACVLEMAPSQLVRTLKEADVVLILDTVHILLQGEKVHQTSADAPPCLADGTASKSSSKALHGGPSAAHNLPSFILAVRILEAMVRKSSKESCLFHQISRRGIIEQVELLNDASACWVSTTRDNNLPRLPRDTIFGRGLKLLKSLQSDVVESGMLHLHKLRNLARRLKEFSDASDLSEKEVILIDLVELFEQPNSITTYEFKQSELLPAILHYLSPHGELDETRALALMRAFERCPLALKHLIFRLQSIITQEETFPLVSFNAGKGRELYPLTRQLKIAFMRPDDRNDRGRQLRGTCGRTMEKSIQSSPLTHFQSFERSVSRCMPVLDPELSLLYQNLVGHSIQKVVEGKWRKFVVVGYDDTRSRHLVKPIDGTEDELLELVLHDSQCNLIESVEVYEDVSLDLTLFGSPDAVDTNHVADGKKKRKNKRKRSPFALKQAQDSQSTCYVEVKNAGVLKMTRLPGAWYAAMLVTASGEPRNKTKDQTCEEVLGTQSTHSVKVLADNRILHNVPVDCLRPQMLQPQVGSVVEVDGALGEVTRIHSETANVMFDVRMHSGTEKSRIMKDHVRFPASLTIPLKTRGERDRIQAMSMRRLFPARDSSLLVGSVGDRVWVLPPSGSSITGLCVAGTIKSFPSGLESIRESATVVVEISFGSIQPPLAVSVNQDRILNLAVDEGPLSGRGPSRLLAALQMASGRSGSSRLFGGRRSGQDGNTSVMCRAIERVAGSLQQSRFGGGQGSSGTTMDHFRSLMSRNSSLSGNAPRDIDATEQISSSPASALITSSPNGSELQTEEETSALSSIDGTMTKQGNSFTEEKSSSEILATLQRYLKPQCAKPKMICSQLPKVSLVVGFCNCAATSITSQDRIVVSSDFGLERVDKSTINNVASAPSSLLVQLNPSTKKFEANACVRKALVDLFHSFSMSGTSHKKKRRKLSPVAQRTAPSGAPWDIDKFMAFMAAVRGPAKYGDTEAIAKYCVVFSKFADPDTNRRLLKVEGFVSFVVHECKDATKSKQMLKFLRSRGYLEKYSASASHSNSGEGGEEKNLPDDDYKIVNKASNKMLQPVVLCGFPADQSVLKCVEDLRREHYARIDSSSSCNDTVSATDDVSLPPWKLTYKLYCDFQVEWEKQSSPETSGATSMEHDDESLRPLSAIASKPLARLLSSGIATLDSDDATDESRWLSRITNPQAGNSIHKGIVIPDSVASAVRLLRYLFRFRVDAESLDEGTWTSPRLCNKLERQMRDVLSMCSGIYPAWCDALVTNCKFFFPRDLRMKLFRSTSFGCTRSLHWFRNQLDIEESSGDLGMSPVVGMPNQEISISPVPKERVKVHRENILQSAEAVMKMHAKRKAVLDVVFVGEKGYGSGVTAAFYSTIAHALQMVSENQINRLWIPGQDDETVPRVDVVGDIADDAPVIRHSNGLFPYPHRRPSSKLLERFRMIGRLAGKALMDERLLPLPLSRQFMKLVVGESFGVEEVGDIFLSHGRILASMYKASKKLMAGESKVQIECIDVQDWLEAAGLTFVDPFSQEPLVAGGEEMTVTLSNLTLYVQVVLELWLDSGIHAQVQAFREGISEVLPLEKLRLLFVPELLTLLCGEKDVEWDVESLTKDTKLAHGYTKESQPVKYLFQVLESMSATERRRFLLYATGCPNLPPGGFQALKPPFEVVRRVVDNVDVDRALPFARTCTNTLHLPAYSTKAVLAKQMTFAIVNSRGVIDRD